MGYLEIWIPREWILCFCTNPSEAAFEAITQPRGWDKIENGPRKLGKTKRPREARSGTPEKKQEGPIFWELFEGAQ